MTTPTPQELVAALGGPSPSYKRAELDAVHARMAECAPLLVDLLAEAAADPIGFEDRNGPVTFAPIYAAHLLAWHRVEAGHRPLLALARMDDEGLVVLLADAVTEGLGHWLYGTCGGQAEGILSLIGDPAVDEWVQTAAVTAAGLLAAETSPPRPELLVALEGLLRDTEEPALASVVHVLLQLGHVAARPLIEEVMASERLEVWNQRTPEELDEELAEADPAAYLQQQLLHYLTPNDLHAPLCGWGFFEENRSRSFGSFGSIAEERAAEAKRLREERKAKKKKRKAQGKARRRRR